MGNTKIKDSITGNIMSLSDGFIPLGMKEHGGVLYIASYNPNTNEGELGSIPSPVLHYSFNNTLYQGNTENLRITDIYNDSVIETVDARIYNNIVYLSDHKLHGGDKFITNLSVQSDNSSYGRIRVWHIDDESNLTQQNISYPIITEFENVEGSSFQKKGWYTAKLYSVIDSGKEIELEDCTRTSQKYYTFGSDNVQTSPYWFLNNVSNFDLDRTRINNYFNTYPNVPSGKLGVKFVPEYHKPLEHLVNDTYKGKYPMVYQNSNNDLFVIVHGFQYDADCPIQPDKIIVRANGLPITYIINQQEQDSENTTFYEEISLTRHSDEGSPMSNGFCSEGIYITFQEKEGHYIISNRFPCSEIDQDIYKYTEIKSVNQDETNTRGLFAVKIPNMNTDVKLSVDLYVCINQKYIQYATQDFPVFNPAIVLLETASILPLFTPQYFDITKAESDYFDIELFRESKQKCFISDYDGNILKYNSDTQKYELQSGNSQTLENYEQIRTYIYPQYAYTGSDFPRMYAMNTNVRELDQAKQFFVKCANEPEVILSNNSSITPLLLPCTSNNAQTQRTFFENEKNKICNLKQSEFKDYCLYQTNLNIINEYNPDHATAFIQNPDVSMSGDWIGQTTKHIWKSGWKSCECYTTNSGISQTDRTKGALGALNICTENGYILKDGIQQQGVGKPTIPGTPTNFQDNNLDFESFNLVTIGSQIRHSNYQAPYISFRPVNVAGNFKKSIANYNRGFVNLILEKCPGYINNQETITLDFINNIYNQSYLYDKKINFQLLNKGNTDIMYLSCPTYYVGDNTGNVNVHNLNNPIPQDDFTITIKQNGVNLWSKSITKNQKVTTSIYNSITPNCDSILKECSEIAISPTDNTKKVKFEVQITQSSAFPELNQMRRVVISPQLFVQLPDMNTLRRQYKSDYQVATQINLEKDNIRYGIYKNGDGAYSFVEANVAVDDTENLLNCCINNDSEFLNVSEMKTPKELHTNGTQNQINNQNEAALYSNQNANMQYL